MLARSLYAGYRRYTDWLIGLALFLFTFAIYLRTLAPTVAEMFDDSLEFQLVAARMAIAHPTGYPLFSILIKLSTFLPVGDTAYRVNLATALFGALTIGLLYAVTRQLIRSRAAGVIAVMVFAFGETFWSQAVLAEVYTLQTLLTAGMLWLTLSWAETRKKGEAATGDLSPSSNRIPSTPSQSAQSHRSESALDCWLLATPVPLAFFFGLMLTHHRMSVLLLPALAVYVFSYDRRFLRQPRTLVGMALAFVLPLLLYLYLPIRGLVTSSLDGTYQNTPAGFFGWVLGSSYNVFLTQNPFNQERQAGYYLDLTVSQFTWVGIGLSAIGFGALARHKFREWLLLALAFAANLAFGLSYRVSDINVFFIPSFLFAALFLAVGIDWLFQLPANVLTNERLYAPLSALLLVLTIAIPSSLLLGNYPKVDLSQKWDVHDYGVDVLAQPLPPNSTIVGILGEMTLLRYLQETANQRPDVQTVAADKEAARISEIATELEGGRLVFLTRLLAGVEKKYSLASFGPLLLVQPEANKTSAPSPSHPLTQEMGGITLLGYDVDLSRLQNTPDWHVASGRRIRATLYWHVDAKVPNDLFVSLKLLNATGLRGGQLDRTPVLDAYPTKAWRVGEYISDTYDLPVFVGAQPGDYELQLTLYDPSTGQVQGQTDLTGVTLAPDISDHPLGALDVDSERSRDFGGVSLVGYSLDSSEPYSAGASIPVTLLWRATRAGVTRQLELKLMDPDDNPVASRTFALGNDQVGAGEYLRQELGLDIAKGQTAGPYTVELDDATPSYLACELPFFTPCTVLGKVRVK